MNRKTTINELGQKKGIEIFIDGDTLVMILPTVADLSLYTNLYHAMMNFYCDTARYILLDVANVETLCPSGIAAFINVDKLTREKGIRLLMLDPPAGIREQLASVLPGAFWIDVSRQPGARSNPTMEARQEA